MNKQPVSASRPAAVISSSPAVPAEKRGLGIEVWMMLLILVWGVNFSVVKAALQQFTPLAFNALRFVLAAGALWLAAWQHGLDMRLRGNEAGGYFVLGLAGITVYQILFIEGIARTTAGNSALILNFSPLLIAGGSHVLGRERMRGLTFAAAVLAFMGLYLIITGKPQAAGARAGLAGDLLTLAAASVWAAYTILAQSYIEKQSALKVTAYSTAFGTALLLLWCAPALAQQDWARIDAAGWSGLLFSGLFSIALAQFLWNYCVGKLGSTRTSIHSNLVPVVALLTGVIFLGERVSMPQALGAAATLAGVALARRTT